jgi:Xaa-Pro aminopeptidase
MRARKLVETLDGIDVMLVSNLVNVRYLTGYSGSNGLALIGPATRTFITDFRYVEQAAVEVHPSFRRERAAQDLLDGVLDALPEGPLRLGFEAAHMSVHQYRRLREMMPERIDLVESVGLVEGLRAIKEPEEIARIRAATVLADAAFMRLIGDGLIGKTERDVAIALENEMRTRGAQRPSFDTIIATGAHGALPHAQPRDVPIASGDLVVIDWGAELDGYCSDCTRTVAAGKPSEEAVRTYELVLKAQLAGVAAVAAGKHGRDVDAVARKVIEAGGHGDSFGHGLGHGVGSEIHEAPRLSQRSEDYLNAGNVVTVEPGVYLPGKFGIRIEDLAVVGDGGCEVLTSVPKRLITTS